VQLLSAYFLAVPLSIRFIASDMMTEESDVRAQQRRASPHGGSLLAPP
jgi:hypothetical protein